MTRAFSACPDRPVRPPRGGRATKVPAAVLSAAAVLAAAVPAYAAAPSNDVITGAHTVGAGFAGTIDTSGATTDADDAAVNADCGAPATDASVWYAYAQPDDGGVIVDVSGSNYSAGVIVASGSPGSLSVQACGPGTVGFAAAAGTTYYVLAFDDQWDGAGNGGTLRIAFGATPPPPTIEPTVDPTATFNSRTGVVTLTGTLTCSNADFVELYGTLTQRVGRMIISGHFYTPAEISCDGKPHPWTATVKGDNGVFKGGKAAAVTFSFGCGPFECTDGYAERKVQISGGR